jgi:hypothetical protein
VERDNPGWGVYDDFQADSVRHSAEPMHSRYFGALLDDLLGYAQRAVVSDVRYCNINEVKALIGAVRRCVAGVRVSVTAIAQTWLPASTTSATVPRRTRAGTCKPT